MNKDSIANYITDIGSDYDPTTAASPSLDSRLSDAEIEILFMQNDIARRVVEEIIFDAFRPGLPVLEYSDTGERVKLGLEESQQIKDIMIEAATNARMKGGGHVLLIVEDGKKLSEPLEWKDLPKLANFFPLAKEEATPHEWGEDPKEPRYQEPVMYQVTPSSAGGSSAHFPRVHYTRLLSFRGNRLTRKLRRFTDDYDDSVLQATWAAISNFVQSENSIVNIINRFETATFSISGLNAALGNEESTKLIQQRMNLAHKSLNILNAMILDGDANETYERRFATVTGLDTLWDRLARSVAKAAKMPMSQLFGDGNSGIRGDDEAGGKGWRKQVEEYREEELLLPCVKIISLMLGREVRPVTHKNGRTLWGHAESPKPTDAARIGQMEAATVTSLMDKGVIGAEEARTLLSGGNIDWSASPPQIEPLPEEPNEP